MTGYSYTLDINKNKAAFLFLYVYILTYIQWIYEQNLQNTNLRKDNLFMEEIYKIIYS